MVVVVVVVVGRTVVVVVLRLVVVVVGRELVVVVVGRMLVVVEVAAALVVVEVEDDVGTVVVAGPGRVGDPPPHATTTISAAGAHALATVCQSAKCGFSSVLRSLRPCRRGL